MNAVEFSLDFTYAEQKRKALKGVSGKIPKGKCVVLCGSSGCGKSTLLRCINHLIPQFYEGNLQGFCKICGEDADTRTIGETGKLAASVFQDPRSQFFTLNSDTEVAFGLENIGFPHDAVVSRVDAAFSDFHLEKLRDRNVFSMSGGERQLTAILSAWAMDTEILLLDEPTANLDYTAIEQLTKALEILKNKGKTLLISEHRLYYLRDIADEYWFMENGELQKVYTADEMRSLTLSDLQAMGLRTTDFNLVESTLISPPETVRNDILQIEALKFRYKGLADDILQDMTLEAHTGEVIGLLGSNGCGKTTLGKLTAGLLKPTGGKILLNGIPQKPKALTKNSIFIMQEAEFQFFTNSVWNELFYGLKHTEENKEKITELLKFTGLWPLRNRHPFSLSGGQMQKLVMLLACVSDKPIVILDEPTAGLDYKSLQISAELIRRMQKDRIVFLISHDIELLSTVCTRSVILSDGKIETSFDLTKEGSYQAMRDTMQHHLTAAPARKKETKGKPKRHMDPRAKLLLLLSAMIVGIGADMPPILAAVLVITIAALYETRIFLAVMTVAVTGGIYGLYYLIPSVATSFIAGFFPRMIVIFSAAGLMCGEKEGPRILAGMRAWHIPERVNMVISVIFRFFPVLHTDLGMMGDSVKTRGFFRTFGEKIRYLAEYVEILIVPMVFRVLRIAETLSASAETRGISLKGKRGNYIAVHWGVFDTCIIILTAVLIAVGCIIL